MASFFFPSLSFFLALNTIAIMWAFKETHKLIKKNTAARTKLNHISPRVAAAAASHTHPRTHQIYWELKGPGTERGRLEARKGT